ncbi:response regulator [Bosea sp. OK403]|uniref:response regulator n=1 Tax=Bosea sp. OK403 TaxID=1855286 RepID=UPI001AECBC06|nr:response regulator [Bosea sp. OK403]
MKILAIDDTKTLLSLLCLTLRNAGHDVAAAENGEEGLATSDKFKPDLVITDLNMPLMDGIEFTRACRARPEGGEHSDHHADHREWRRDQGGRPPCRRQRLDGQTFRTLDAAGPRRPLSGLRARIAASMVGLASAAARQSQSDQQS